MEDENEAENKRRWEEEERRREEEWAQRYEERKRKETLAFELWRRRWDARKKRHTFRRTVALGRGMIEALGINVSGTGEQQIRQQRASRKKKEKRDLSGLMEKTRNTTASEVAGEEIAGRGNSEAPERITLRRLVSDEEDGEAEWAEELKAAQDRIQQTNMRAEREAHQRRDRFYSSRRSLTASEKRSLFDEYFDNEEQIWRSRGIRLLSASQDSKVATELRNVITVSQSDFDDASCAKGECARGEKVALTTSTDHSAKTKKKSKGKKKEEKDIHTRDSEETETITNEKYSDGKQKGDDLGQEGMIPPIYLNQNQVLHISSIRRSRTSSSSNSDCMSSLDEEEDRHDFESRKQNLSPRDRMMDILRQREMEERARILHEMGLSSSNELHKDRTKGEPAMAKKGKKKETKEEREDDTLIFTRRRSVSVAEGVRKGRAASRKTKKEKRMSLGSAKKKDQSKSTAPR